MLWILDVEVGSFTNNIFTTSDNWTEGYVTTVPVVSEATTWTHSGTRYYKLFEVPLDHWGPWCLHWRMMFQILILQSLGLLVDWVRIKPRQHLKH